MKQIQNCRVDKQNSPETFVYILQFQVKVHDLPGGSTTNGRGSNALKFFNTHQLKVS